MTGAPAPGHDLQAGGDRPAGGRGLARADRPSGGSGLGARGRLAWLAGLLVALVLAAVVSFYASASPDGLERVSEDTGFAESAKDSGTAGSPLSDYQTAGVEDERLSGGLAGAAGVVVVAVVGTGLAWTVRRRQHPTGDSVAPATAPAPPGGQGTG